MSEAEFNSYLAKQARKTEFAEDVVVMYDAIYLGVD